MNLKINNTILCIPPHISTTWNQVTFLGTEKDAGTNENVLVIHLIDQSIYKIPRLDASVIDLVFAAHANHLEAKAKNPSKEPRSFAAFMQQMTGLSPDQLGEMPFQMNVIGIPGMSGNLESLMQHNQEQADQEDLPSEMLDKVREITKALVGGDHGPFPKPEPHCNCTHCQIARAIHGEEKEEEAPPVADEELTFRSWDMEQTGEDLYVVTNPLDEDEKYHVYLGSPVGCTCGKEHCEHLRYVLQS